MTAGPWISAWTSEGALTALAPGAKLHNCCPQPHQQRLRCRRPSHPTWICRYPRIGDAWRCFCLYTWSKSCQAGRQRFGLSEGPESQASQRVEDAMRSWWRPWSFGPGPCNSFRCFGCSEKGRAKLRVEHRLSPSPRPFPARDSEMQSSLEPRSKLMDSGWSLRGRDCRRSRYGGEKCRSQHCCTQS